MNPSTTLKVATLALAVLASPALGAERESPPTYWISVLDDGANRVTFDELAAVSDLEEQPSATLELQNLGQSVALWVEDGGDGLFGPGDSLEFLGEHLYGEVSYYHEHSPYNVYRLSFDEQNPRRWSEAALAPSPGSRPLDAAPTATLSAHRHFETDALMVRFRKNVRDESKDETWFWQRLTYLGEPFQTRIELPGLTAGPATVKTHFKGWSRHRNASRMGLAEHRVEILVNGTEVGSGEWDGQTPFLVDVGTLPDGVLATETTVGVRVPERVPEGQEDPLVDLSLLNWIEIDYPHSGVLDAHQVALTLTGEGPRDARLVARGASELTVFDGLGRRWHAIADDGDAELRVQASESEVSLVAVAAGAFEQPAQITVDQASDWRREDRSADYLMVAHHTLLDGARRLADYHRERGLDVEVIDVQDLYDEFSHGIVTPQAIRDFVDYATNEWAAPAPRYLLLVGDASWDIDGRSVVDENYSDWSFQEREATREGFIKNRSTQYEDGARHRGLVPTGSFSSAEGHAASDNYFAAIEPGSFVPVLAVGRIPVVEPSDLEAIVDKTIRYIEESGVGPWRRKILWISNEQEFIQKRTDQLANDSAARGFASERVYPQKEEASNEGHQQHLIDAFAEGQLVVYFHGHGGRYIWRTGATDYRKNRDLFNLEHLEELEATSKLPVILSMTCYSAPFDHPLADSIGEKFLRLPDSGAIAVFAASWRNSPAVDLSRALVEELTRPQTIGEAILNAKRATVRRDLVETYNLLGDPAVPMAAPQQQLQLIVEPDSPDGVRLAADFPDLGADFRGRAIIEWIGAGGELVASEEVEVHGPSLETTLLGPDTLADAVSVYVWDAERGVDALGAASWASADDPEGASVAAAGSGSP